MTNLLIRLFIKNGENPNSKKVRQQYGTLGSVVGIFCNVILFASKFIAGLITSSISITADAFNNLSDAGSSIVALLGFKMAGAPADDKHPFGHGRIEYISGLIVSMIIMLMGFELAKSSVAKIVAPQAVEFSVVSLVIMLAAIAVKLWMCLFNRKLGNMIHSGTLKATAMDSLSDVVATSTVVVGMLISYFTGVVVDGYIGVIVALFILYTGYNTVQDTLSPLLGQAPSQEFVQEIEQKVLSYDQVVGIHDLIVHNYGPGRSLISLHAEVPCHIDILKIHDTIDIIERELKQEFDCEAVIHMDPIVTDDQQVNKTRQEVSVLVKMIDPSITIHDFRMVAGPTHTNLIFDVVVPHKFRLTDEQVVNTIRSGVKALHSTYELVITVDKNFV